MIGFMRDVFRVLSLSCREHTVLFSRQLDEPLPRGVAAGLRIHVMYCGGCSRFRRQIRGIRDLSVKLGQDLGSGEAMPQAVQDRVLRSVSERSNKI